MTKSYLRLFCSFVFIFCFGISKIMSINEYKIKLRPTFLNTEILPTIDVVGKNIHDVNLIKISNPSYLLYDSISVYKLNENDLSSWESIGKISSDSDLIFEDNTSNKNSSQYYRVAGLYSCGLETPLSQSHRTVCLNFDIVGNSKCNLNWNKYEGENVQYYSIKKGSNLSNLEEIGKTTEQFYSDTIDVLNSCEYYYCIDIIFEKKNLNKYLLNLRSNTIRYDLPVNCNVIKSDSVKFLFDVKESKILFKRDNSNSKVDVSVFNIYGNLMFKKSFTTSNFEISVRDFPTGLYIVNFAGDRSNWYKVLK